MFIDVSWPGRDLERPERMVVGPEPLPLSARVCDGWGKMRPIPGSLTCVLGAHGPALEGAARHGFVVFQVPPTAAGGQLTLSSTAAGVPALALRVVSRRAAARAEVVVWSARLVCLLSLLALLVLFPQTEEPLHKLGALTFAGLSLASLSADLVRRALRRPLWSSVLAFVMCTAAWVAWWNGAIVQNRSLDKITQAGDSELAPGQYGVRYGLSFGDALCRVGSDNKNCVGFDAERTFKPFWAYFIPESLIVVVGCKPALPEWLNKDWETLGACKPDPKRTLEGVDLQRLSGHADRATERASERVALVWPLAAQISSTGRPTSYRTMRFEQSSSDFPALSLRLENRDCPLRSVSVSQLEAGRDVLCPADDQGLDALGLTFLSNTVALGNLALFAPYLAKHDEAEADVRCWFASVGRHLARYAVWGSPDLTRHPPEAVSTFRAQSDTVSAIPICVPRGHALVDAELTLGESWSPSLDWTLQLPAEVGSKRIRIIDGRGRTLGDVTCPNAQPAQGWDVGPLFADESRDARGELTTPDGSRWSSAQRERDAPYFWGCWRHAAPPEVWHATERWVLSASPQAPRSYVGRASASHCYRYRDGQAEVASKCKAEPKERAREWYAGWGDSQCDKLNSDLCVREVTQ